MPRKEGFQLTDGDIAIFRHLWELRLACMGHLEALTGRSNKALYRRLQILAENGYLYRARSAPNKPYVYAVGTKARPILVEQGVASAEDADRRIRLRERMKRHDLFLRHTLLVTDIHAALRVASKDGHVLLQKWAEDEIADSVVVLEKGRRQKLPVRPDAFFVLRDSERPQGRNDFLYFLEADRSTTTHVTFQRKVRAYRNYLEQGLFEKKHGVKRFQVVTVTLTEARAKNLCEAAQEALPEGFRRMFLFALAERFSVSEEAFITPKDFREGVRYRLVPPIERRSPDSRLPLQT
jgi:hypothetical protein